MRQCVEENRGKKGGGDNEVMALRIADYKNFWSGYILIF